MTLEYNTGQEKKPLTFLTKPSFWINNILIENKNN